MKRLTDTGVFKFKLFIKVLEIRFIGYVKQNFVNI